jgi:phosphoglycolate phosphatase-like HAD superfamily hydrolase
VAELAIAVDLDAVLADTRPVWDAWVEDASRRARVPLSLPADREEAARVLDTELGDWRPLLDRFAADRAPLWFRPRAETNAVLRRLAAAGARIGAFTDAPRTLAELALAHTGSARYVDTIGTLAEVQAALGNDAIRVTSRETLAEVEGLSAKQ